MTMDDNSKIKGCAVGTTRIKKNPVFKIDMSNDALWRVAVKGIPCI